MKRFLIFLAFVAIATKVQGQETPLSMSASASVTTVANTVASVNFQNPTLKVVNLSSARPFSIVFTGSGNACTLNIMDENNGLVGGSGVGKGFIVKMDSTDSWYPARGRSVKFRAACINEVRRGAPMAADSVIVTRR